MCNYFNSLSQSYWIFCCFGIILIPKGLKEKLLSYASQAGIQNGYLFKSRNGKPLNRSNIWRELKRLCEDALVNPNKVFPHNFRHLFAKCYYAIEKDIAHLADILGHSSVDVYKRQSSKCLLHYVSLS